MGKYSPETITTLSAMMKQLSEGEDPTSGLAFPEDSVLNSRLLKSAFASTSDILKHLAGGGAVKPYKAPFSLTREEAERIPISEEPQPISRFVFTINNTVSHPNMRKLYAKQITEKLTELHYLKLIRSKDGREYKVATEQGEALGTILCKRTEIYHLQNHAYAAERFVNHIGIESLMFQYVPAYLSKIMCQYRGPDGVCEP